MAVTLACLAPAQAAKVALLVGVGHYPHLGERAQLAGPPNDVAAMQDVLVRRWGFKAQDVKSLVNAQATRDGILAGLKELTARSKPGDDVLIYFSGHGTSAADAANRYPLPHSTGGFMPHDMDPSRPQPEKQLIVGRTDLVPLLKALEDGGRKVLFITDSCFSQNAVRSGGRQLPARMVPLLNDMPEGYLTASLQRVHTGRAEPYPYKGTATLAASAEGEVARDIPPGLLPVYPTLTGKPHGAFTDALLRVLEGQLTADANRDGQLDLVETHAAINRFMATRAYGQAPQRLPSVIDDTAGLGSRVAFGGGSVSTAPAAAAVPASAASSALKVYAAEDEIPAPLLAAVGKVPGVQLVAKSAEAELRLRLRSRDPAAPEAPRQVALVTVAEDVITTFGVADVARLEQQLAQIAWSRRVQALALQNRRGALSWGYEPDQRGSNFYLGDDIQFVARPDRAGWLLLLNVDSQSNITVLYPGITAEMRPLAAGQSAVIPEGAKVRVVPPLGMDVQVALVFDEKPQGLDALLGFGPAPPHHPRWATLAQMLEQYKGRFTFAHTELRVYAARQAKQP